MEQEEASGNRVARYTGGNVWLSLVLPIAVILALVGTLVALLWKAQFFSFSGRQASAQVVAASLALTAAFVTAIASVLGLLLRHSIDQRSVRLQYAAEERLRLESERNLALHEEAEERLKLDSAMRAVDLLTTQEGLPSHPIQRAGALLALANLRQHQLTLALVDELLSKDQLEASTAAELINIALKNGDVQAQELASSIFFDYADRFVTEAGPEIPVCMYNACDSLSPHAREWITLGLGKMLLSLRHEEWKREDRKYTLYAIIATMASNYMIETDNSIRNDGGAIMACVLRAFPEMTGRLRGSPGEIDVAQLRSECVSLSAAGSAQKDLILRLSKWADIEQST